VEALGLDSVVTSAAGKGKLHGPDGDCQKSISVMMNVILHQGKTRTIINHDKAKG
jgi:hypothetical protein